MTQLPETELAGIARGREAFARFGWKPYMHNPHLKRWLHRIDIPTLLLWGEQDGIVRPSYGEAWRAEIPGARMEVISDAGHFPHWEQPRGFADRHLAFHRKPTEERAMRCWYFSEMAYHPAWEAGLARGSLRVVLPSSNFDPPTAHGLLNRYLDEFALCDEVGLDIMVNEHHSTATCMTVSVPMALAIIARETKTRAAAVARHADRQPARSGARGRGDGVARRAVGRAAGDGPGEGRAVRDRSRPTAIPPR